MKKVIFSLALGTFGLGMAEFGIMGVLTELARDVGITIPAAGHMISFYAFGVVLGAAGGQIAFNLGSAIGAWCGGLMLTLGFAYHYVALPAALLSFSAMSSLLVYGRLKHKQPSVTSVAG